MGNKTSYAVTLVKGFVLFMLLWQVGAWCVNSPVLPGPLAVFLTLDDVFAGGGGRHLWASCLRLFKGIGLSLVVGTAIGLSMGSFQRVNKLLNPLIYFTYPIPKTALLPVIMILFGLGDASKVTLIVLITVFQVIVAVRDAVAAIPDTYYLPLISLGASRLQRFYHVTVMCILPDLLTALRLSVGTSLSILFFAENFGTTAGLGYYIQDMWNRMNYNAMFGGIFLLAALGFVLFMSIDLLERALTRWQRA